MDDVRIPETVEEYQRALRGAFIDGATYARACVPLSGGPEAEVRRRYPITRKVARVFTVENPKWGRTKFKVANGSFWTMRPGEVDWVRQHEQVTPENVRALADLLDNPHEEVAE